MILEKDFQGEQGGFTSFVKGQKYSLEDLPLVAEEVINFNPSIRILTFEGEMGSGKTTLIKEIAKGLKVIDKISSPTFSIINEYLTSMSTYVYHFDFYRIKSETEALDIGCEEYFQSGFPCLIEWPSKISFILPVPRLEIRINSLNEKYRKLEIKEVV